MPLLLGQDTPSQANELVVMPMPLTVEHGGRFPTLAADPQGNAYVTWYARGEAKGETKLQQKKWDGETWSATTTIAEGGGWMVNWADFAKFSIDADGGAMVTWLAGAHGHHGYGVMYQKRRESGAGWTDPKPLHVDRDAVEHGFVSLLPYAEGNFFATWIQSTADGPPTNLRYCLYGPTGKPGKEHELDPLVCDCCGTSAVSFTDGHVLIAYRNRSKAEVRNIQLVYGDPQKPNSWKPSDFAEPQDWTTRSCPVNGPSLAAMGQNVVLAYYHQGADGAGQVKFSWSKDGGAEFQFPSLLQREGEILGRVGTAMLREDLAVLTWLEHQGETSRWMACTLQMDGKVGSAVVLGAVKGARADGFLQLIRLPGGVMAAWNGTTGGILNISKIDLFPQKKDIAK